MYSVISLFSGAGGFDLGFTGGFDYLGRNFGKNNFDIIFANDFDRFACQTYRKNFTNPIFEGDISQAIEHLPHQCDVLIGGFPCQPFSTLRRDKKSIGFNDERGHLYKEMMKAIEISKPKVFIAENVQGILSIGGGEVMKKIIEDFSSLGYTLTYQLYDMSDYGVPQMRKRVIIVGTRNGEKPYTAMTTKMIEKVSVLEAIGDLEFIDTETASCNIKKSVFNQSNLTLREDAQSNTITASGMKPIHYNQTRRLSLRECGRIQTFPDNFDFSCVTKTQAFRQIGNAVPPVFAWHLARHLEVYLASEQTAQEEALAA